MSLRSLCMQVSEYNSYVPYSLMCFLMKSDTRQVMSGYYEEEQQAMLWQYQESACSLPEDEWRCLGESLVVVDIEDIAVDNEWVSRG
jgi:hypothetical protein